MECIRDPQGNTAISMRKNLNPGASWFHCFNLFNCLSLPLNMDFLKANVRSNVFLCPQGPGESTAQGMLGKVLLNRTTLSISRMPIFNYMGQEEDAVTKAGHLEPGSWF